MAQKYRVEVSQDLHRALKLSAELHRQDLRDYAAPFLEAAIDPRIKDLLTSESEGPRTPGPEGPVAVAKAYILAELEAGREPTAAEVAGVVGMESRPLGALMNVAGYENQVCRRGGTQARRYTLDMLEDFKK